MPNKTLEKWEEKTLEDILDKGSSNLSANKLNTCEGDYPVYGASGLVKRVNFYQQEKEYLAIIKDGAGVGRVYHYEPKSSILGTLQYLFPKENVNIRFAYYYLQSLDFAKYYQGAAIPHIYYKDYKNEKLVLPPLPEQQRIVGILDEAFENIEKSKQNALQNLNNAKELFENILNETFIPKTNVWKSEKLENICYKVQNRKNTKDINEKFLYVDIASINNKLNIIEDCKLCNGLEASSRARQIIQTNDILFSTVRTYLKNIAFVTKKYDKQIASTGFCVIRTNPNKLLGKFMFYKSLTKAFLEPLNELQTGASYPAIRDGDVFSQIIEYPPLEEQQKIVQQLDELQEQTKKLEQIYEQKVKDLDELKQSILQKAFNGEL